MRLKRGLALLILAATAAACSGEPPAPDRTLRYRVRDATPTLDPVQATDDNSNVYVYLVFDGLVEFVPGSVEVRPAVAESWSISDDGLNYTFKLRPGVRFHNGREVTSKDVVWSLRRALTPASKSQKRGFFSALKGAAELWDGKAQDLAGAAAPDPRTVVLTLSHPYEAFLSVLASEAGSIMPEEVYSDPASKFLDHPVGCGPFAFESMDGNDSITLRRFPQHWKPAPPDAIERIVFRRIESPSTALEEYRAGSLDYTQELPPGQRKRILEEMPGHIRSWMKQQIFYLDLNHVSGPLAKSRELRQAIFHAVNREFIVRTLQEEKDALATGILPPGMLGHSPDRPGADYDPNLAADLLAQAGYPKGKGLGEFQYYSNDTQGLRLLAERVQSDLARIGLKTSIHLMDFPALLDFLENVRNHPETAPELSIYRQSFYADYPDPDNLLTELFTPRGYNNSGHYDNPSLTALLSTARHETDRAKREALYRQAETMLLEDVAIVPIYWFGQDILLRPEVTGFKGSPLGVFAIAWEEMGIRR